ncbi:hypothetical protein [Ruegeria sp.]|uniref:hypothetical protein n=1 Tax=Ruegeria sp. TaxID=1879320 RepID=UPI00230A8586|nr:hypothetical protein [Ruegeria sp.]MDA7964131.1 hypothetical protein [Ruegeria sp.]
MTHALIGHTGFVGHNLWATGAYDIGYNSKNFREMAGQSFDTVTCAGVQAVKWWANQNAEADWAAIEPLLQVLDTVQTRRLILISTVDVYKSPIGVDESSPTPTDDLHAYGLHRLRVEDHLRARFDDCRVLRLPGLFGNGLKKNLIFDALTGGGLSGFDARSRFQFYHLNRLKPDIDRICQTDLSLVNLAVEPVSVRDVVQKVTGQDHDLELPKPPFLYDMQTCHAGVWGQSGPYLETAPQCLQGIAGFADQWRRDHS